MKWGKKEWMNVVNAVAPTIATALGGPLAGAGVAALSRAILKKNGGTEAELAEVIASGDPDVLVKLKQAELEFQTTMKELDIDEQALYFSDRADARNREIQLRDKVPAVLSGGVIAGFLIYVTAVTFLPDVPVEKDILMFVLGQLSGMAGVAMSYYLGSSRGSKDKNTMLSKIIK